MSPFHFSAARLQLELACAPTQPKHSIGEDGDFVGDTDYW